MPHQVYLLHHYDITLQRSQEVGGTASPVLYDELEGSAAVAVLQQSGDYKLKQHKLKLNLPNGAHGAGMCVWCAECVESVVCLVCVVCDVCVWSV